MTQRSETSASKAADMRVRHREVVRTAALSRIEGRNAPRAIMLEAPAGYGKSTVIRQIARREGGVLLIDGRGITGVAAAARRVVEALIATLSAERAQAVNREAAVAARDEDAWRALAIETWRTMADRRYVVFENAERLADLPDALAFVNELLDVTPAGMRIAVCSRTALGLRIGRVAPPHETLLLRADDLRFSRAEIQAAFAGMDASDATIEAVEHVTHGWPMAVYLLRRLHSEGRLLDLDRVEDDVLGDYLVDEVLELLDDASLDALIASAAIPGASLADLTGALAPCDAADALRRAMEEAPFLIEDGEVFEVHPLLRTTLCQRYPERARKALLRAAAAHDAAGRDIRAAQLYLEAGDQFAAACAIRSTSTLWSSYAPPLAISSIIAQLDSEAIVSNPVLWNASMFFRRFEIPPYQWIEEGMVLWRRRGELSADVRAGVMLNILNAMVIRGALDAADTFLNEYAASLSDDERPVRHGTVTMWSSVIRLYRGYEVDADAIEAVVLQTIGANTALFALWQSDFIARRHRMHGDESAERTATAQALDAAETSQIPMVRMLVRIDAAFTAWMQLDDAAFEEHVRRLEALAAPAILDGLRHFLDCVRGRPAVASGEKIHLRCWGWLIAAARADQHERRLALVASAREAADESSQGYTIVLSRIASALIDGASRDRWLDDAHATAERFGMTFLVACVDALRSDRPLPGLTGFVERFRSAPSPSRVMLIDDAIWIAGNRIAIPDRPRQIVMYLAAAGRPIHRDELLAAIWPDEDPRRAGRSLITLISRVRDTCGDRRLIVSDERGYALGPHVAVDIDRIRADADLAERGAFDDRLRARLLDALSAICRRSRHRLERWEWFQRCGRELDVCAQRVATVLADDAARHRLPDTLASVGRALLALDPTDEHARSYVVRAHLLAGQTAAARREVQEHERALREELGIDERSQLRSLLPD